MLIYCSDVSIVDSEQVNDGYGVEAAWHLSSTEHSFVTSINHSIFPIPKLFTNTVCFECFCGNIPKVFRITFLRAHLVTFFEIYLICVSLTLDWFNLNFKKFFYSKLKLCFCWFLCNGFSQNFSWLLHSVENIFISLQYFLC